MKVIFHLMSPVENRLFFRFSLFYFVVSLYFPTFVVLSTLMLLREVEGWVGRHIYKERRLLRSCS